MKELWAVMTAKEPCRVMICDSRPSAVRALEVIGPFIGGNRALVRDFLECKVDTVTVFMAWSVGWIYPAQSG